MTNTSPEINHIATALAKAQASMSHAGNSTDGVYAKFANYESIVAALKSPLSKNDLSYSHSSYQIPAAEDTNTIHIGVSTILIHGESGQFLRSSVELPVDLTGCKSNQSVTFEYGKVTTYLKRYTLAGITGLATGEDDNEDKKQGKPAEVKRTPKKKKVEPKESRVFTANENEIRKHMNANNGTQEKLEQAHKDVLAKTNDIGELEVANAMLKELMVNFSE